MDEINVEFEITQKDRDNYIKAIRKYLGIKYHKMTFTYIIFIAAYIFCTFVAMISSEYVLMRYICFILIFFVYIVSVIDNVIAKRRNKINESKIKKIDGDKAKYKFTKDFIEIDTPRIRIVYKKEWIKYLFFYGDNMAILSEDYNGILIASESKEICKKIEELYSSLEKIYAENKI